MNISDRNPLGCQYPSCACAKMKEFARGEESARSLRNGITVRSASIDIAEIRGSAESYPRSSEPSKSITSFRIANGWGGAI